LRGPFSTIRSIVATHQSLFDPQCGEGGPTTRYTLRATVSMLSTKCWSIEADIPVKADHGIGNPSQRRPHVEQELKLRTKIQPVQRSESWRGQRSSLALRIAQTGKQDKAEIWVGLVCPVQAGSGPGQFGASQPMGFLRRGQECEGDVWKVNSIFLRCCDTQGCRLAHKGFL
jgi:hypothetical protein